jgi:hypothetical protein
LNLKTRKKQSTAKALMCALLFCAPLPVPHTSPEDRRHEPTFRRGRIPSSLCAGRALADYWTLKYFGDVSGRSDDRSGANDDADGDDISNLDEYLVGTSPKDATNAIRAVPSAYQTGRFITFSCL